jgi:hypothetical protein
MVLSVLLHYKRLNMFRAALCPSSGAHDYISDYHTDLLILRLLMVGGQLQAGWLSVRAEARTLSQSHETWVRTEI